MAIATGYNVRGRSIKSSLIKELNEAPTSFSGDRKNRTNVTPTACKR